MQEKRTDQNESMRAAAVLGRIAPSTATTMRRRQRQRQQQMQMLLLLPVAVLQRLTMLLALLSISTTTAATTAASASAFTLGAAPHRPRGGCAGPVGSRPGAVDAAASAGARTTTVPTRRTSAMIAAGRQQRIWCPLSRMKNSNGSNNNNNSDNAADDGDDGAAASAAAAGAHPHHPTDSDEWHPHDPAYTTPQLLASLWGQIAAAKDLVRGVRRRDWCCCCCFFVSIFACILRSFVHSFFFVDFFLGVKRRSKAASTHCFVLILVAHFPLFFWSRKQTPSYTRKCRTSSKSPGT
jgi:hypothetical protein